MKTVMLLVALWVMLAVGVNTVSGMTAAAPNASALQVGGSNWFFCAAAVTLLIGGTATQQYYLAAAGAIVFPTACALGW